jgi:hypothetical protein
MGDADKHSVPLENPADDELDSFVDELDEFDLLSPGSVTKGSENVSLQTDLSTTARAFNTRIQRKKKEQEEEGEQAEKVAKARHLLMLRALMNLRKSLRDLIRVDLGERFRLTLAADDWLGWPRLTIKLQDKLATEKEYSPFVVTAHDRYDAGTIEIAYCEGFPPERISLARDFDLKRLPNLLRKCVRTYLDYVGDIVLRAERKQTQTLAARDDSLEKKSIDEFVETDAGAKKEQPQLTADLFMETYQDDIFDKLPELDQLEALPELASAGEDLFPPKIKK